MSKRNLVSGEKFSFEMSLSMILALNAGFGSPKLYENVSSREIFSFESF